MNSCHSVTDLFAQYRAPFITLRDAELHIGSRTYSQLTVYIHEVLPVRKYFHKRTLKCYSLDCRTGKDGRHCELCSDRFHCSRRLQLRLAYYADADHHPAILELPTPCFPAFDALIKEVGSLDKLLKVPIGIKAIYETDDRTVLDFELLF